MYLYFDESGNTGCVLLKKNGLLNFRDQPVFAIGAIRLENDDDRLTMENKYIEFKEQFGIKEEIKGSKLLTRDQNQALLYLLDSVFDLEHFHVILYDKRFYIATLLLIALLGASFQQNETILFYEQASMLALQEDSFFEEYCKYIDSPSVESFHEYLLFLTNYNYRQIPSAMNVVKSFSSMILENKKEESFYDDFMTYSWYENENMANVINLNALSELIFGIKVDDPQPNESISYIHDHIQQFEPTLIGELKKYNINIAFRDSKEDALLQLADNLASITCHAFVKMRSAFQEKREWESESEWEMMLAAKIFNQIGTNHINFTVPLQDWAASLCVCTMFTPEYPKQQRNNLFFNDLYRRRMDFIKRNIFDYSKLSNKVDAVMKK